MERLSDPSQLVQTRVCVRERAAWAQAPAHPEQTWREVCRPLLPNGCGERGSPSASPVPSAEPGQSKRGTGLRSSCFPLAQVSLSPSHLQDPRDPEAAVNRPGLGVTPLSSLEDARAHWERPLGRVGPITRILPARSIAATITSGLRRKGNASDVATKRGHPGGARSS